MRRTLPFVFLLFVFFADGFVSFVAAQDVRILEPAEGARYESGDDIAIRWELTAAIEVDRFEIEVVNGTTFTTIARWLPADQRQFTWRNAGPPGDRIAVFVRALNEFGASTGGAHVESISIAPPPPGSLPWPWVAGDVGTVGAPGTASYANGTFAVSGSGSDIWATSDEFHFAHQTKSGDFDIEAHVNSVENINQWTKAGLMIRNGAGPSAAHVSLFATPTTVKGLSYQTRHHSGDTSLERRRISLAPPYWIKLMRRRTAVQAAYRRSATDSWTLLPFVGVLLEPDVEVGFAVSSHVDGTLATASFSEVRVTDIPTVIVREPTAGQVLTANDPFRIKWSITAGEQTVDHWQVRFSPDSFTFKDVAGCNGLPGSVRDCLWRNPTPVTEQGLIQVSAIGHGGQALDTANSGTFRIRIPPGPPHVTLLAPQGDMAFPGEAYRIVWDASDDTGLARFDVSIRRWEDRAFTPVAGCSNLDGSRRGCDWLVPDLNASYEVRVVATDRDGITAESRGDVFVESTTVPLPEPWVCGDIGAVAVPGACRGIAGDEFSQIEVDGSGSDIWGTADEFTFARQEMEGDFSITTRVNRVENVNQWTKVGIMIRDWNGGSPGARHASLFVTPSTVKGTAFQRRPTQGGATVHTAGPAVTAPVWLRLVRSGDVISAYVRPVTSFNDQAWTLIGRQQFSGLPSRLSAMLVSSSHVDGTLATGNFEGTRVGREPILQSIDIGTTAAGRTGSDGTTVTIEGDGADIWGTSDAFRFHYTRWSGDGTLIARVRSLENTHAWTKAGVMIRESLDANSKHAMAVVSSSRGIAMQYRGVTGGSSLEAWRASGVAPKWLRIDRRGNQITAFTSDGTFPPDGDVGWESLGEITLSLAADVYFGLAVTSHSPGALATAVFDDVIVRR